MFELGRQTKQRCLVAEARGEHHAERQSGGVPCQRHRHRGLATFFETCDVFLCPTLCLPPLRIGELDTMSEDLSHIAPILRRYMPATSMFNMSGQPAMSVPLAWNSAGLPLGMMFAARFGDEATLFRLAAQLEQERPWRDKLPPVYV